jgi:uncharacterized membrane protein
MMIIWIIIIGGLFYYLYYNNTTLPGFKESPKETLKRRLAKGEISIEEYQNIIKTYQEERK